jgi:hypothetical protein
LRTPAPGVCLGSLECCGFRTKVVYICHPFRGDVAGNREHVRRICAAVKRDYVPLAPHLMLPAYIDESTERDLALEHGLALLRGADELWVCADAVSEGMAGEIAEALRLGVPVYRIDVRSLLRETCAYRLPPSR